MVGDVVGRPGRRAVSALLPGLRQKYAVDMVIANGENAAGGAGLTWPIAQELFQSGVDVLTSGNHIWDQKEIIPYLDKEAPILRPLNYPPGVPGQGFLTYNGVAVINLMGRVFMGNLDCPFRAAEGLLKSDEDLPSVIVVDFHGEATSEKMALGWYLDGQVSAVVGTHTHVGTVDARILPQGTAYITDVGMVGPRDSVIGNQREAVINRFLTQMPSRFPVADGPVVFNAVLLEVAENTGRATDIHRVDEKME